MELKAIVCPHCGARLDIEENTTLTTCPYCDCKIHISYDDEKKPEPRQFKTAEGLPIASAFVPSDFKLEAIVDNQWQSELIPFTTYITAKSPDENIFLASTSKERFYDLKNPFMKQMLLLVQNHTNNGYISFIEPEEYYRRWAQGMVGIDLTPVAKTNLPSVYGNNLDLAKAQLESDNQLYLTYLGENFPINRTHCESVLYKYSGKMNGRDAVVLVGVDYAGTEFGGSQILGGISDVLGKGIGGLMNSFGQGSSVSDLKNTFNDVISGKDKMTMDDWMHGGLVGKMMRDKKKETPTQEPVEEKPTYTNEDGTKDFGHGDGVSMISFGAQRKYLCLCPVEQEKQATEIFLRFVGTLVPDESLAVQENKMVQNKIEMVYQEANRNQAMAQQMYAQTLRMQQQTSQMIARNSQQISDGIMDSWNKRQAAQSRMSANYSEAIRGVNSYVTPTGKTVEMDVVADHVYQNKYGDTIGVSGNAIDDSLANKLDWTELKKK